MSDLRAQAIAAAKAGDMETARKLKAQHEAQRQGQALSAKDMAIQAAKAGDMDSARQYKALWTEQQKRAKGPEGSFLDPVIEGATLGFRDELAGGIGVLDGLASGMSWSEAQEQYAKWKLHSTQRGQNYETENPALSPALEFAGGALTGGGGALRSGARSVGARALSGGAMGALSAAGHSEDLSAENLGFGAGAGALLGAAVPVAGQAIGRKVSRMARRLRAVEGQTAAEAGAEALEQGMAQQLGFFGNKGLRETKKTIREKLRSLSPTDRQDFQNGMLRKAEEVLRSGDKINPVQLQGLKSTLRTTMGGARHAKKVMRGVDRMAKGGKTTNKAAIAARLAEVGLKSASALSANPKLAAASALAGRVHRGVSQRAGLALPSAPPPPMSPQMLNALMGFSAHGPASLLTGGGQ